MEETKTCTKCNATFPLTSFHKKSRGAGLRPVCRTCSAAQCAAYREANKERERARAAAYRRANREIEQTRRAAWLSANREHVAARRAARYAANRDRELKKSAAYYAANPEKFAAKNVARRQRVRRRVGWYGPAAVAAVYRTARWLRSLGVEVHVDHACPLKGKTVSGLHVQNNLRLAFARENLRKGASRYPAHGERLLGEFVRLPSEDSSPILPRSWTDTPTKPMRLKPGQTAILRKPSRRSASARAR